MFDITNFNHLFNIINNLLFFICGCIVLTKVEPKDVSNIIISLHIIIVSIILTIYEFKHDLLKNYGISPFIFSMIIYSWNGLLIMGLYKIGLSIGIFSVINSIFNLLMYFCYKDKLDYPDTDLV